MTPLKQRLTFVILLISALLLNSCATIFNSRQTTLNIITNQPSRLVVANDTLKNKSNNKSIVVNRDKEELKLTVFTDSLTKTVNLKSFNSFAYWSNFGFYYGVGMLVDFKNPKRYGYPKTVYVNFNDNTSDYLTFIPIGSADDKYWNILKWTPLKLAAFVNPSVEVSYERRTGQSFSTQVMASYLLPETILDAGLQFKPHIKGFRVALEERFYFKKSAPFGPYIALEVDYLKNSYNHDSNFIFDFSNYRDTVSIKKENYSFNFKIGHQIIIKQFSIDLYAGLGFRYKNVKHFNKMNPEGEIERPRHPNIVSISNQEGKYSALSIPLNVRIGWTF